MTDKLRIGSLQVTPIPPGVQPGAQRTGQAARPDQPSFEQVLRRNLVRFSHHAETRLQQRGIRWNEEKLAKLESAVNKAESKGARESLILFQDVALIVNVKNRTVVTAMDGSQMKDNVFTQIDSAVIVS